MGLREIVALAVSTGNEARGHILGLRFLDVDLSNRRIMPATDEERGRPDSLSERNGDDGFRFDAGGPSPLSVFARMDSRQGLRSAFEKRKRKELQLTDFRFHDLRHTAASWMRMRRHIHTVAQLLGHKDLRMGVQGTSIESGYFWLKPWASSMRFLGL